MEKLIMLAGLTAGAVYVYQNSQPKDNTGQNDISDGGRAVFQKIDRVLAYRLLKAAHEEVTDFDALTDSDLSQLLTSINIDPNVLKTKVSAEQAEFLMNSAKEAARLRTEITISIETKKQWNNIIRASEKQKVARWVAEQNITLDTNYSADRNKYNPLIQILNRKFETWIANTYFQFERHCPKHDVFDYIANSGFENDPIVVNKINILWDTRITSNGTLFMRWVIDDILIPLATFLEKEWAKEKQTHTDLLAVQKASKETIIDGTDYVATGWTIGENGNVIESQN